MKTLTSMKSKPTLLLNPGVGWSGTTPFLYTLAYQNNYAHQGHYKENWYLSRLENDQKLENYYKTTVTKRPLDHPMGNVLSVSNRFAQNTNLRLIRDYPNSIENYISYFTEHYNNVKNTYTAVCDFSNANVNLSQSFLESISKKLLENFEIKVTFQFRDPIRRFFSETGSLFTGSSKVYKDFMEKLYTERKKHKKLFFYFLRNQYFNPNCEYVDLYKKYSSVFGKENCYYIIMEDFWDDKQRDVQLDKLSNFLNYKITKIHENAYVPDMGSNAPKYDYLRDQWESDIEDLTESDIKKSMNYMKHFYENFENYFGYIPLSWRNNS